MTVLALTFTIVVSLAKAAPAVREQDSQPLTETEKLTVEVVNARIWGARGWKRFRHEKLQRIHLAARVKVLQRQLLKLRGRRANGSRAHGGVPAWFLSAILCIHRGESSDWYYGAPGHRGGNGFEGGLQFLQSTWLSAGGGRYAQHAYQASPSEQIAVAYSLYRSSGFSPWPRTARVCGVL